MFDTKDVSVSSGSKYQEKGVSEKVTISEVVLVESNGITSLQLKTVNESGQEGQSKRLSLKTDVSPGKTVAAWTITAKYLLNVIKSATGVSDDDARLILKADSVEELKKQLTNTLIGKTFRGLFSSREYAEGKFAIELYITEPVGGTRLVFDPSNKFYNTVLPKQESGGNSLPF